MRYLKVTFFEVWYVQGLSVGREGGGQGWQSPKGRKVGGKMNT